MLTKLPEPLATKATLLVPSGPKNIVWVLFTIRMGVDPLNSRAASGVLARRIVLLASACPNLKVLTAWK